MSPSSARLPRPSPALAAALLLAATLVTVAEARVQVRPVESTVVLDGFRPSDFADPDVQRDFCAAFTASIDLDERYCEILSAYRPCASCSGVAVRFIVYIPEWIPGGWWYAYDRLIVVVRYDVRDTLIRYNPIFKVVAKVNVVVNVGGDKDSWKNSEKDIDEPPAVDDASRVVAPVEDSPPEGEPVVSPTDDAAGEEDRGAPATDPVTDPVTDPESDPERDTPDDEPPAVDQSQTTDEDRGGERDVSTGGEEPASPDPGQTGGEGSADSEGFDFANERETRESDEPAETVGPGEVDDVGEEGFDFSDRSKEDGGGGGGEEGFDFSDRSKEDGGGGGGEEGFDFSDRGGGAFDNRGEASTGGGGGGRENRDFDFSGGGGCGGGFGGDAEAFPVGGGDGGGGGGGGGIDLGGGNRGGGSRGGGGGGGGRRGGGRRGGDK